MLILWLLICLILDAALVWLLFRWSSGYRGMGNFRYLVAAGVALLISFHYTAIFALTLMTHHHVSGVLRLIAMLAGVSGLIFLTMFLVRRASLAELHAILAPLQEGVVVTAHHGALVWMNPAADALFGVDLPRLQHELRRRSAWDWFNHHLRNADGTIRQRALLEEVVRTGIPIPHEKRQILRPDGTLIPCDVAIYPVRDWRNRVVASVEFFRDMREQEELAAQRLQAQKMEATEVLAGGIAHDFNNLLQIVQGNLEMLTLDLADHPARREMAEAALSGLERASALTRQLSAFAKGITPQRRIASLVDVFREAVDLGLRGSPVKSRWTIPAGAWLADIDVAQLHQVVLNLTLNAVQAMPNGGTLAIEFQRSETPAGARIDIVFRDDGPGIAPEHLHRIFDPYFSTKRPGRGLGLAMAYAIITQHQGRIRVDSTLGEGTTFYLTLPASTADAADVDDESAVPHGSGRILVMDDEPGVLMVADHMLRRLGYEPVCTTKPAAAWSLLAEDPQAYQAAILDRTIPGGPGGVQLGLEIKREMPHIPVILATGYAYSNEESQEAAPFDGTLTKPFSLGELARVLDQTRNMSTVDVGDLG